MPSKAKETKESYKLSDIFSKFLGKYSQTPATGSGKDFVQQPVDSNKLVEAFSEPIDYIFGHQFIHSDGVYSYFIDEIGDAWRCKLPCGPQNPLERY